MLLPLLLATLATPVAGANPAVGVAGSTTASATWRLPGEVRVTVNATLSAGVGAPQGLRHAVREATISIATPEGSCYASARIPEQAVWVVDPTMSSSRLIIRSSTCGAVDVTWSATTPHQHTLIAAPPQLWLSGTRVGANVSSMWVQLFRQARATGTVGERLLDPAVPGTDASGYMMQTFSPSASASAGV